MAHAKFDLTSLSELDDARVLRAFQKECELAVKDCLDRPMEEKPRKVTLELLVTPVLDREATAGMLNCIGVKGEFEIKGRVPVRRSAPYEFRCNSKGEMIFNTNSPTVFDQKTFADFGEEESE